MQTERYRFFRPYDSFVPLESFLKEQFWSPLLFEHIFVTELMIMKEASGLRREYLGARVVFLDDSDRVIDSAFVGIDRILNKASTAKSSNMDVNPSATSCSLPMDMVMAQNALASNVDDISPPLSIPLPSAISQDPASVIPWNSISSSSSLLSESSSPKQCTLKASQITAHALITCSHKSASPFRRKSIVLSTMSLRDRALLFDELAVLAHVVTKATSDHNISSYWFTSTIWDHIVAEKDSDCTELTTITQRISSWLWRGAPPMIPEGVLLPSQEPPALRIAYEKEYKDYKDAMLEAKKEADHAMVDAAEDLKKSKAFVAAEKEEPNQVIVEAEKKTRSKGFMEVEHEGRGALEGRGRTCRVGEED